MVVFAAKRVGSHVTSFFVSTTFVCMLLAKPTEVRVPCIHQSLIRWLADWTAIWRITRQHGSRSKADFCGQWIEAGRG